MDIQRIVSHLKKISLYLNLLNIFNVPMGQLARPGFENAKVLQQK